MTCHVMRVLSWEHYIPPHISITRISEIRSNNIDFVLQPVMKEIFHLLWLGLQVISKIRGTHLWISLKESYVLYSFHTTKSTDKNKCYTSSHVPLQMAIRQENATFTSPLPVRSVGWNAWKLVVNSPLVECWKFGNSFMSTEHLITKQIKKKHVIETGTFITSISGFYH